jgi:hypothetical protein
MKCGKDLNIIDTRMKLTLMGLKTAVSYVCEGQVTCTLSLELKLSHADVKNGAIGCHSDMWAGTHPHHDKTPLCSAKAQQPVPWTRTECVGEFPRCPTFRS